MPIIIAMTSTIIDQSKFDLLESSNRSTDTITHIMGPVSIHKFNSLKNPNNIIYLFGDVHMVHTDLQLDSNTQYLPVWLYQMATNNPNQIYNIYIESIEVGTTILRANSGLIMNMINTMSRHHFPANVKFHYIENRFPNHYSKSNPNSIIDKLKTSTLFTLDKSNLPIELLCTVLGKNIKKLMIKLQANQHVSGDIHTIFPDVIKIYKEVYFASRKDKMIIYNILTKLKALGQGKPVDTQTLIIDLECFIDLLVMVASFNDEWMDMIKKYMYAGSLDELKNKIVLLIKTEKELSNNIRFDIDEFFGLCQHWDQLEDIRRPFMPFLKKLIDAYDSGIKWVHVHKVWILGCELYWLYYFHVLFDINGMAKLNENMAIELDGSINVVVAGNSHINNFNHVLKHIWPTEGYQAMEPEYQTSVIEAVDPKYVMMSMDDE